MKRVKLWIRNYFGFSRKETNGFVILMALLVVLVTILLINPPLGSFSKRQVDNSDQSTLDSLEALIAKQTAELAAEKKEYKKSSAYIKAPRYSRKKKYKKTPAYTPNEFFAFDPNTATVQDWQKLGFSAKVAGRIQNYVSKGGKFRQKSDLKKIYGFPERAYDQLEAYIQLPDKYEAPKNRKYTTASPFATQEDKIAPFDLNEATTEQLKQIKGIGEALSERIINLRNRLGGFSNTEQLKDIYGLKPEVIATLLQHTSLTPANIKKININTAKFEILKAHPYIGYKLAKIIVNYREHHGNYNSIKDLGKIKIIDEAKLAQLTPYIAF
ncbi:helix-hairpin-helix domain-containing protein [uncultured Microscilla sp.]|uniref:helix-hairpin-helix domain-containing protein n=1 Tax=uncultured Microscilla sp. TaxID=432653 RepID=UPI00260CE86A|nr:helix-hairpin-helix domain-containing protein [uncultured Microscilla sp.]